MIVRLILASLISIFNAMGLWWPRVACLLLRCSCRASVVVGFIILDSFCAHFYSLRSATWHTNCWDCQFFLLIFQICVPYYASDQVKVHSKRVKDNKSTNNRVLERAEKKPASNFWPLKSHCIENWDQWGQDQSDNHQAVFQQALQTPK